VNVQALPTPEIEKRLFPPRSLLSKPQISPTRERSHDGRIDVLVQLENTAIAEDFARDFVFDVEGVGWVCRTGGGRVKVGRKGDDDEKEIKAGGG
jgi:hypothetical protein